MSKVDQWNNYKNFCKKNGLKENNFNSMKKWVQNDINC
ncbi:hypothetical protein JOC62_003381 [Clostridium sardiniense]|nr:hypothetical protein [Clostridium sardiniense]